MPKGIIIFLVVAILLLIFAVHIIIIDSKISKESKKIALIKELNKSIKFHEISNFIEIRKHYDNKTNYNKIEPGYLMSAEIRNKIEWFSIFISQIKENRENKIIYNNKVEAIISQPTLFDEKKAKIFQKEYLYREKRLIRNICLNPVTKCRLCVYVSYSSPKGQVRLSKESCFSFEDIVTSFESVSRKTLDKSTYSKLTLVERGEVSDSMRYDILMRDEFKCVICGASSREGARLHVDHIVPVSKGGKSIPSNLRTLCERCNIGKSNKIEKIDKEEVEDVPIEVCPKCGGEMVLRHGKHGDFYGCSNYPKCKFTRSI